MIDEQINTTRALSADQSKEEEFVNVTEVSGRVYTNNYSYYVYSALIPG